MPMTIEAPWTIPTMRARLAECAHTLAAMPGNHGPAQKLVATIFLPAEPDMVQPRRPKVSPAAVDRMDETLAWICGQLCAAKCLGARLAEDSATVVWGRARGWTWQRIAEVREDHWPTSPPKGNTRPSLMAIEQAALSHLATVLNRSAVAVDEVAANRARIAEQKREPRRQTAFAPVPGPLHAGVGV